MIAGNPTSLKIWWSYLSDSTQFSFEEKSSIYQRALKALPSSYKLWYGYLYECLTISRLDFVILNKIFESALVTMHKMPRIWIMYLEYLIQHHQLTRIHRTFDHALSSLPVSQHARIWVPYIKFFATPNNIFEIQTSLKVRSRYLEFDPTHIEEFVDFLVKYNLAPTSSVFTLVSSLNDDSTRSKTTHQMWLQLCGLLVSHSNVTSGLNIDAIIRCGICKFATEVGCLWTSLATYYIRRGLIGKARDIFEEGMSTVVTHMDFCIIFDSYVKFEESTIRPPQMETLEDDDHSDDDAEEEYGCLDYNLPVNDIAKKMLHRFWLSDKNDVDFRHARVKYLMDRRQELENRVLIRQNPHDVEQWHRMVKLFKDSPERQMQTYSEAITTVDPMKAVGEPHTLWVAFAKLYEDKNDVTSARGILENAVQVNYKTVDDLASVWCQWAEMELRQTNFKGALELMRRATEDPFAEVKQRVAADKSELVQMKLRRLLRLWECYLNLEKNHGTLESTRAVYEKILDLNIATPQIVINYASVLEENSCFEDAFKVYERGVSIFKYPHAKDIWVTYLSKFVERYEQTKLECVRELFERALEKAYAEDVKPLCLQCANLEEQYGLPTRRVVMNADVESQTTATTQNHHDIELLGKGEDNEKIEVAVWRSHQHD